MKELHQSTEEWDNLQQRVIDSVIKEWCKRLHLRLMEDISYMHYQHDCFASCFNAACVPDY